MQELSAGPAASMTVSPQPFVRLCTITAKEVDEVRLAQNVKRIDYEPRNGSFMASLNGLDERFDHVVVPSGADVEVFDSGKPVRRRQFHFDNHHLLFEAAAGKTDFSYVAFMADARVRRVVDSGSAATAADDRTRRRYLAHVRNVEVSPSEIVDLMARHGLLDATVPGEEIRRYRFTSTRTLFTDPLPPGLWAPDTYGDLSDNLARLLSQHADGKVRMNLPFTAPSPLQRVDKRRQN